MGIRNSKERTSLKVAEKPTAVPVTSHFVNNRRYLKHGSSVYHLPVDDMESDRLQSQHFLLRHLWKGNFSAPIEQQLNAGGVHVLDIACGCGTWVLEMSTQFWRSQFFGVDMLERYPADIKPANANFEKWSVLQRLNFPDNYFHFVHIQSAQSSFTEEEWRHKVIPEMIRVTKPGGWFEISEIDFRLENSPPNLVPIIEAYISECQTQNITHKISSRIPEFLSDNPQVTELQHQTAILPYYMSFGHIDEIARENLILYLQAVYPVIRRQLNITLEEYEALLGKATTLFHEYGTFNNMHRFYGQKKCIYESALSHGAL